MFRGKSILSIYSSYSIFCAMNGIFVKVLYHTCLFMHEFSIIACMANIRASDYPSTSRCHRVTTHLRVEKSTSRSCVLSLDYIGICYLCHIKVPNMHKYFKPCLLCEVHFILDKLKQEKYGLPTH